MDFGPAAFDYEPLWLSLTGFYGLSDARKFEDCNDWYLFRVISVVNPSESFIFDCFSS